jgi:hypothetical protein
LKTELALATKRLERSIEEIADAYVRTSGRVEKIAQYFENPSIGWSELEDLALAKPEDSPEF